MTALLAIAHREFASFFRTPLGWVVIALFVCLSSIFFVGRTLVPGSPASMREFFGIWWGLLLVIAPAISMRLFSEELRTGMIEASLTAPVSDAALVLGKFLAGLAFLITMLLPTIIYVLVLESLSRPDFGPIVSGYLGLVLLGMLYIAIGTVASVLTASQTLAFLGTLFALLVLDVLAARLAADAPDLVRRALFAISPSIRANDFSRGLIDSGNVAYFVVASGWCLALATLILQSRRWR